MRILIDQGVHDLRNKGNNAMLEVALERFTKRWPDASLEVITQSPHVLRFYFPKARPVSLNEQFDGSQRESPTDVMFQDLPRAIQWLGLELHEEMRRRRTNKGASKDSARFKWSQESTLTAQGEVRSSSFASTEDRAAREFRFTQVIKGVDLYAAVGGQYISDVCKPSAIRLLDRIKVAVKLGVPCVMLGQGMGPIEDPELRAKANEVLPLLPLIAVREKVYAPQLLEAFGVDRSRIVVTGDDAIEMTFEARREEVGTAIGVGIRVVSYTEISEDQFEGLKETIHHAASLLRAKLIALPISQHIWEADNRMIGQLMAGYPDKWIGWSKFESCSSLIRRVSECRLVVTGAFHTAVFALAQGIPAVCIASSAHYANKFMGLADQFGEGCSVILVSEGNWQGKLLESIKMCWRSYEDMRPLLLKAAVLQIEKGNSAYNRVFELVESMKKSG